MAARGDSFGKPARDAPVLPHGAGRLVRYALAAAVALALATAPSAMGADLATPDWSGVDITGARSVTVGLDLARAYWHMTVPATVTIVDVPGFLAVAEYAPLPDGGYGRHIGVTRTALTAWPAGTAARCTQLPALLVHEYGHLLGYRDGILYPADPSHVMLEYSNYFSLRNEPPPATPRGALGL